jgi:hypothetical protein
MNSFTDKYKVDVPPGKSGRWEISKFTIGEQEAQLEMITSLFSSSNRGMTQLGTYTRLTWRGTVVMSDTPDEIRDHLHFIRMARGRVLIHGLGIGMCTAACLRKPEVKHVTVVDKSPDVIRLVGPSVRAISDGQDTDLEIIEGDAFTWKPPKNTRWDVVWHDIWESLCTDNLSEMTKLHRRFGRRTDWQDSWGKALLKAKRRRQ